MLIDKKKTGFTLLEVMMVLTVISILAGMLIMRFGKSYKETEITTFKEIGKNALYLAQSHAHSKGRPFIASFNIVDNRLSNISIIDSNPPTGQSELVDIFEPSFDMALQINNNINAIEFNGSSPCNFYNNTTLVNTPNAIITFKNPYMPELNYSLTLFGFTSSIIAE